MDECKIVIVMYSHENFGGIDTLWREAFPGDPVWNRAQTAIPAKLAVQPELLPVAISGARVVGSAMAGCDGHRGWLYAVAVLKSHQRQGIGRADRTAVSPNFTRGSAMRLKIA